MSLEYQPIRQYYERAAVRVRMRDFLGADHDTAPSCIFLTAGDRMEPRHHEPRPPGELARFWEEGWDIARSLWDRECIIAHLDVEYVNFDHPAEAYLHPERTFAIQEKVVWAIEAVFRDYGLKPLHLLSGRGHHFVWKVESNSAAMNSLAELGQVPTSLEQFYRRPHHVTGESVAMDVGAAFSGLGLVMEYLAHRIKEMAAPMTRIPVEFTAIEVGPSRHGRELVSLDISEYGDPLSSRVTRVPFSVYYKPWQQRALLGEQHVAKMPPMFLIPLAGFSWREGIRIMRDAQATAQLAESASTRIPCQHRGTEQLIRCYRNSPLARFHRWYYAQQHDPPESWPHTYDRTPLEALPYCARHILEHPNDLLLRPGGLERIVRVMLALGWHPRHAAGLVRSKFERDHGWGKQWEGYDPGLRADFYTRVFAGLFVTGGDDLIDLNCQSAQEEKLCFLRDCPDNLAWFRESLLDRRKYERLASRPFNRLFLPEEHL